MSEEARADHHHAGHRGLPCREVASGDPALVNTTLTPVLVLTLVGAWLFWALRRELTAKQSYGAALMLVIAAAGLVASMVQIRAINIASPAVPFLAGFLSFGLVRLYVAGRQRLSALLGLATVLVVFTPDIPYRLVRDLVESAPKPVASATASTLPPSDCRTPTSVARLKSLPDTLLLTHLNFGTFVLAYTGHSVTAAPYHRSTDAFWNGVAPFEREAAMIPR